MNGFTRVQIDDALDRLIDNLVNIKDEDGAFLLRLDDGRVIDTKGWNDWEWTHGVGLYGLLGLYQQTGDLKILAIMQNWFRDRFEAGTPTKNINTVSPFLTLAYLYEQTKEPGYRPYLEAWADWLMDGLPRTEEDGFQHIVFNDENPQELWDDTLMMSVLPLAKIGLVLDRPLYVEEAKKQFLIHIKYLFDRSSGLWFHGWTFLGRHNFANALWARGNCWVTIAIPEFIEMLDLPAHDSLRRFLVETLEAQLKALAAHQDESGLWRTLIQEPQSYLEASASAGFAYGVLKAVRKRYVGPEYAPMALKAVQGLMENISPDGELLNVSFGTPVFDDLQGYRDIPLTSMPYGQALAVLALSEFRRGFI